MKTLRFGSLMLLGLVFGPKAGIQAAEDDESYRFFDGPAYTGHSVVLSACNGTRQPLHAYGLAKQVSSWVNNTDARIIVEDAYGNFLWSEPPHSRSPEIEPGKDNRAWYVRCLPPG